MKASWRQAVTAIGVRLLGFVAISGWRVYALILFAVVAMGLAEPFVSLPLGNGFKAFAFSVVGVGYGGLMMGLALLALLAVCIRLAYANLLALILFLGIFLFPVLLVSEHADVAGIYLSQVQQRTNVYQMLQEYFSAIPLVDTSVTRIDDFYMVLDQCQLLYAMLGQGWFLALLGSAGLAHLSFVRAKASLTNGMHFSLRVMSLRVMGVCTALVVAYLLTVLALSNVFMLKGQHQLASGKPADAKNLFAVAVRLNPWLILSQRFALDVWETSFRADGTDDFGHFGKTLMMNKVHGNDAGALPLVALDDPYRNGDPLKAALSRYYKAQLAQLNFDNGSELLHQGRYIASRTAYDRALVYQQRIDATLGALVVSLRMNQYADALSQLDTLVPDVGHPVFAAYLECVRGDILTKMKRHVDARQAYWNCRDKNKTSNLWASRALAGS